MDRTATSVPLVPLRRNRDFLLYWSSQVVSTLGTRVTSVAYPLLVLATTGSPARAGIVGFAQTLPFLVFFLPAGAIVDRGHRKRIMLASDAVRAVAMASIVMALAADRLTLWHIVVVAFVEGTFFVLFELAEAAALPHLVPEPQLPTAIAQNQARQQGADLVGQPLGGVLFGIGRAVPFLADALSYAVSFVALLFVRQPFQDQRERAQTTLRAEMREGVAWLWHQPFLRTLVVLVAGWNFVSQGLLLALIVRARELGASPALIGAMLAFWGGGALLGALVAPVVHRRLSGRIVIVASTWLAALTGAALVPLQWPLALGAVVGLSGIGGPVFNVVLGSYRYALTPDRLQGRVVSAARVVAWGSIPLGAVSAGAMLESFGGTRTLAVLAALMAVVAAGATFLPSVRQVPEVATGNSGS